MTGSDKFTISTQSTPIQILISGSTIKANVISTMPFKKYMEEEYHH